MNKPSIFTTALLAVSFSLQAATCLVTWNPSPPDEGVSVYHVYCRTNSVGTNFSLVASTNETNTIVTGIGAGIETEWYATAENSAGESDESDHVFYTAALNVTVKVVTLAITPSASGMDVTGYNVYTAPPPGINFMLSMTITNGLPTSAPDPILFTMPVSSPTYVYVTAVNSGGFFDESDPSNTVFVRPKLQAPGNLIVQ